MIKITGIYKNDQYTIILVDLTLERHGKKDLLFYSNKIQPSN